MSKLNDFSDKTFVVKKGMMLNPRLSSNLQISAQVFRGRITLKFASTLESLAKRGRRNLCQ